MKATAAMQRFIRHFAALGPRWGSKATPAAHALLYLAGTPLALASIARALDLTEVETRLTITDLVQWGMAWPAGDDRSDASGEPRICCSGCSRRGAGASCRRRSTCSTPATPRRRTTARRPRSASASIASRRWSRTSPPSTARRSAWRSARWCASLASAAARARALHRPRLSGLAAGDGMSNSHRVNSLVATAQSDPCRAAGDDRVPGEKSRCVIIRIFYGGQDRARALREA